MSDLIYGDYKERHVCTACKHVYGELVFYCPKFCAKCGAWDTVKFALVREVYQSRPWSFLASTLDRTKFVEYQFGKGRNGETFYPSPTERYNNYHQKKGD